MNDNAPTTLGAITGLVSAIGFVLVAFTDFTADQDTAVLGLFAAIGIAVGVIGGQVVQKNFTDPKPGGGFDERGAITAVELCIIATLVLVILIFLKIFAVI